MYQTLTQKQVIYEWFSTRFHTNLQGEWLSAVDSRS